MPQRLALIRRIKVLEEELLQLRAELAGGFIPEDLPAGDLVILVCRVGTRSVAVLQSVVETVVPMVALLPIDGAAPSLVGLLDLHGEVLPVLDLQDVLTGAPRGEHAADFLLVVRLGDQRAALLVGEVLGVERAPESAWSRLPDHLTHAPHLLGSLRLGEEQVPLLGVAALLARTSLAEART